MPAQEAPAAGLSAMRVEFDIIEGYLGIRTLTRPPNSLYSGKKGPGGKSRQQNAGDPAQAGCGNARCPDTRKGSGTRPELTGRESHRDDHHPVARRLWIVRETLAIPPAATGDRPAKSKHSRPRHRAGAGQSVRASRLDSGA